MSISRGLASVLAAFALVVGCAPTNGSENQTSTAATTPSASEYILPAGLGRYTNVWSAEPGVDLNEPSVVVVRAAVEAKAIADMVGRYASYPGYGRLLDEGTSTPLGRSSISVEDTPKYREPIPLDGTMRYGIYDVHATETSVDARVCDISFGTYQPSPAASRTVVDPVDLSKVTEPALLDEEGHIPSFVRGWRIRLDREQPNGQPVPTDETTPAVDVTSDMKRYPNYDAFAGWQLREFSINPFIEPRCDAWAAEFYPMAVIGSKGLAYPTNPVDPAYLPTLPPFPGWTHIPAV